MRILLRGPYTPYSGYGNDLLGLAAALDRLREDVHPNAVYVMPPLPDEVARLFTKEPATRYDVCVEHVPPFDLRPPPGLREMCDRIVGWTMWEQTVFSAADMKGHGQGRWPWTELDHILCYDQVSKGALDGYSAKPSKSVLQGGVDPTGLEYHERDWAGRFVFGMLGELTPRKDPFVAIEAFRELRLDGLLPDAELHLKTSKKGLHPSMLDWCPGLVLHAEVWSVKQVHDWLRQVHVLLAPSRGEGKNLPALEIMLTGGTVIATNWGGHMGWMHPDYAYPLDYRLEPVAGGSESLQARASKEHMKQLLVKTYENRGEVRRKGEIASRTIRQSHSWDSVARRLLAFLRTER